LAVEGAESVRVDNLAMLHGIAAFHRFGQQAFSAKRYRKPLGVCRLRGNSNPNFLISSVRFNSLSGLNILDRMDLMGFFNDLSALDFISDTSSVFWRCGMVGSAYRLYPYFSMAKETNI
jgi:hypothetical protein